MRGRGGGRKGEEEKRAGEYRYQRAGKQMEFSSKSCFLSCMRSYYSRLGRINFLEPAMAMLTDEQLKGMTGVGLGRG